MVIAALAEPMRCCRAVAGGALLGVAIAAATTWVVLGHGPESLFHIGEAVYDDTGHYLGVR